MSEEKNIPRVYMTAQNKAGFTCPKCNKVRVMDVSQFKDVNKPVIKVKCKCTCGHKYSVLLERRREIRKEVNLTGRYETLDRELTVKGTIIVKDLSRSGLRFQLKMPQEFKIGETLMLEFTLNDRDSSQIKRKVIVRSQFGVSVGTSFESKEHFDKLGPYLLYSL